MDQDKKERPVTPRQRADATSVEFPRRRLARIIHDERGQASMEWERLDPREPAAASRVVLSLVEDPAPTVPSLRLSSSNRGVDPYDRGIETAIERAPRARRPSDLRQLDAWIRQRRAVEANRRGDEGDKGDED